MLLSCSVLFLVKFMLIQIFFRLNFIIRIWMLQIRNPVVTRVVLVFALVTTVSVTSFARTVSVTVVTLGIYIHVTGFGARAVVVAIKVL